MTDISEPALEKAIATAKEKAPSAVGKVETAKVDVSKEADIEAVVAKLDAWGGVDVMFNNAGIMHADDAGKSFPQKCKIPGNHLLIFFLLDAVDTPEKIWDLTQNINVKGVWSVTPKSAPILAHN